MSWAKFAIEAMQRGETVQIKPRGHSMKGKVNDGDLVTVASCDPESLSVGDILLVRVHGNDYLHLLKARDKERFQIGNNRGGINGWVGKTTSTARRSKLSRATRSLCQKRLYPKPPNTARHRTPPAPVPVPLRVSLAVRPLGLCLSVCSVSGYNTSMEFAWNPNKAAYNLRTHGVSFLEAGTVFDDPFAVTYEDPDHSEDENRFITFGLSIQNRFRTVC